MAKAVSIFQGLVAFSQFVVAVFAFSMFAYACILQASN